MESHCFFAHVAVANDASTPTHPQATANLLIEINDAALASGKKERHLDLSPLSEAQRVELAAEIAKDAASTYLGSEEEFRKFPVQTFVDFNVAGTPHLHLDSSPHSENLFEPCQGVALGRV